MNERWNLDVLYLGFDDPCFAADLEALQTQRDVFVQKVEALEGAQDPTAALKECILALEAFQKIEERLGSFCGLRQAADTRDNEAGSNLGRISAISAGAAGAEAKMKAWIAALPDLDAVLERDEMLREYRFVLHETCAHARHLLGAQGEELAARLRMSGSSAWGDLQSYLTSSVQVEYNGGVTNLSSIRNLAYDADPAVRKAAYEAELACYKRIEDSVAYALNSIKLETISMSRLRGYASPLDATLKQSRMSRETLDAMLTAMDEYLPKFWAYLRGKGRALGHENGLPWYDLFAPMGKTGKTYTTQDAKDYLLKIFHTFDDQLRDMVETAFDDAWIDFFPRDGKVGGAFCASVSQLEQSRILTNFDGSFSDIVTLAHELGHAFHNQCLRGHRILNRHYSMPVAETASTFNECVIMNAAIAAEQDPGVKLSLIESQLSDAAQIICDIYSRYRFETAVFANREAKFMPAEELCGMMLEAQKASYGDGLDHSCLHPYMWICKSHYYGTPSFYNFPYAFGGLFARGLYAQYEQEGAAFLPKYKSLLRATTVSSAEETAKIAGIDLQDPAFWRLGLEMLSKEIDLFLGLIAQ